MTRPEYKPWEESHDRPRQTPFYMWCQHNSLLAKLSVSCATPLGGDSWETAPVFLSTVAHVPFLFANFSLYPFAVISLSL